MFWTTVLVVLITGINYFINYEAQKQYVEDEVLEKAQLIAAQFLSTREFIADNQGGVDYDAQGDFVQLHPTAVGQGVGEIFSTRTDYSFKQTNLNPRAMENAPDEFERQAMEEFRDKPWLPEYWGEDVQDGRRVFRYLVPLEMEEPCLACHGQPAGELDVTGYPKEGSELGDWAGAISITLPLDDALAVIHTAAWRQIVFFIIFVAAVSWAVHFMLLRFVSRPLDRLRAAAVRLGAGQMDVNLSASSSFGEIRYLEEQFRKMAEQLKEMYDHLELNVQQRTSQLEKANEELRLQKENLKNVNKELETVCENRSQFLTTMSHELRTPLSSIIAFSELLLRRLPPDGDQKQRKSTEEIRDKGELLLRLIDNLLDWGKIEIGCVQLELELVDLVDVIGSVEKIIAPLAQKQQLSLETYVGGVPLIKADPEKVHRALLNLVSNAVKFTPAGGRVGVKAHYDESSAAVIIDVEDTGIGISKENQEVIFDRFRQVGRSSGRRYKGTGLGLALAKELIEFHGGRITVESRLGQGSIFTVSLPVNSGPEKPDCSAN